VTTTFRTNAPKEIDGTMKTALARMATVATTCAIALAASTATSSAHIGTSEDEVAAGSTTALGLTVGHGCGESSTTEVAVQIPEGINNAQPFAHPGWSVATEMETLSPPVTSAHGDEVTERVAVITFTAAPGQALPHDVRDTFTINFTAPDSPGETLWFKTVQTCEEGENAWIEEWDGEGEEPDRIAPSVVVGEPEGDAGHGDGATVTTEMGDDEEATDSAELAASSTEDDDDGNALAVAALVVAVAAAVLAGLALASARRSA
jgi:uncharacterized protein YcnI